MLMGAFPRARGNAMSRSRTTWNRNVFSCATRSSGWRQKESQDMQMVLTRLRYSVSVFGICELGVPKSSPREIEAMLGFVIAALGLAGGAIFGVLEETLEHLKSTESARR